MGCYKVVPCSVGQTEPNGPARAQKVRYKAKSTQVQITPNQFRPRAARAGSDAVV